MLIGHSFYPFFLVGTGHALNLFCFQKKVRGPYEYGLYDKYKSIDGDTMRLAMKKSCAKILATADSFGFSIYAEPEKFTSGTLKVGISANDQLIDQLTWETKGSKYKYYHIPGIKGKYLKIRISAKDSFNPYKSGFSNDIRENRDQSVAITGITFFRIPISKGIKECVSESQEK